MLDPLELVRQAKNRHYAYKSLENSQKILGEDYTPSILQGRDITKNPAGAAALAAQGVRGANTPQIQPNSPLNSVEPTANGQVLPGFADGGDVISKVTKVLSRLLGYVPDETKVAAPQSDRFLDLARKFQNRQTMTMDEYNELIGHLANAPTPLGFGKSVGEPVSAQEKLRRTGSQLYAPGGDPYNTADSVAQQKQTDELLSQAVGGTGYAGGGEVQYGTSDLAKEIAATPPNPPIILDEDEASGGKGGERGISPSSLKWIADAARKLGIDSMAEDRARVATGIAKQFYGLNEHGQPKFGGEAWLSSQHGTPPRILDELTSIPGSLARLANVVFGGKIPANANVTPEERRSMERQLSVPKWSDDAAARVEKLDKAAEQETGVGTAHSLPEHIEDAAAMLATPLPASKVAGEAPMIQRIFEYLTPVRPPTMSRYATDSAILGGAGAALDEILDRMSARAAPKDTSIDPEFEQAAMDSTNSHY